MKMEYEKVIEKLIEYGELLSNLKDSNYKQGKPEMENIDKKVKLLCNRIYENDDSDKHLIDCGYHFSLDKKITIYLAGADYSDLHQEYFNNNLERRIAAIENLLEDYITWGLPGDVKSETTETGFKLNGKIFEISWKKTKSKGN